MEQFIYSTYTIVLPIIVTALMGYVVWLLKNQKKDRDANSKGTMLLLRVQLIEYHDKYMRLGDIPSYAYENFIGKTERGTPTKQKADPQGKEGFEKGTEI